MYIIYKLTSPSNKSYIGQTKRSLETRWNEHIGSFKRWDKRGRNHGPGEQLKLMYALSSYDPSTWTTEVLAECDETNVNDQERYFINHYDTLENGYNIAPGGQGWLGANFTEEHKQKLSESRKRYWNTDDGKQWKEQLSKKLSGEGNPTHKRIADGTYVSALIGYKHTDEAKAKMSEMRKGKSQGPMPEEVKKKISDAKKGKYTDKQREGSVKAAEKLKGRKHSAERLQKMSDSMKGKNRGPNLSSRESKSATWLVIDPDGNESVIKNKHRYKMALVELHGSLKGYKFIRQNSINTLEQESK